MVSGLLNSVLLLQSSIFRNLGSFSSSLQRIFYLKNRLFDAEFARAQAKPLPALGKADTREIENPATTIIYVLQKPNTKSVLNELGNSVLIEHATATWTEFGAKREIHLITMLYQPPKKEA